MPALFSRARHVWFYRTCGLEDSVEGRLSLLSLHLALMMDALRQKGPQAQAVAQALADIFVQDMDGNLRELGVGDLSLGRVLKKLAGKIQNRTDEISQALSTDSPLDKLLQTGFFSKIPLTSEQLSYLANYVHSMAKILKNYPEGKFHAGGRFSPSFS